MRFEKGRKIKRIGPNNDYLLVTTGKIYTIEESSNLRIIFKNDIGRRREVSILDYWEPITSDIRKRRKPQ